MMMRISRMSRAAALLLLAVGSVVTGAEERQQSDAPAVLPVFSLSGEVVEAPGGDDFLFGSFNAKPLKDIVARMKQARDDEQVKGVVLLVGDASLGYGQIEEIRRVMHEIRSAGKDVFVHAEGLSMSQYVLASGGTRISVVPTGPIMIQGLFLEELYVRGLLDMIGVKPDFMTCGRYKSAAEMFMRTGPSPEAEEMMNWLADSLYDTVVRLIAEGRGVPSDRVRQWIDGAVYTAGKAKELGIVDAVEYTEDFLEFVKGGYDGPVKLVRRYGRKKREEIDLSSPLGLIKLWAQLIQGPSQKEHDKPAIAVVYVDGPIVAGQPQADPFATGGIAYSTPIRKALEKAAEDDSIKGVVLRVDSPGGSAVGSEVILNATKRVKEKKPFAVSMGNIAGSGGYYVACGAETIFADAATITASIGVVGGKFATTQMWNKVGISWKSFKRGANAGILASEGVFSDSERARMRELLGDIYEAFKAHVVAARGKRLKKDVEELAGGRVFTGQQALQLGLVDRLGGLDDAVRHVAKQAGIEQYEIRVLPRPKSFFEILLSDLDGDEGDEGSVIVLTGGRGSRLGLLEGVLPQLRSLEPSRLDALRQALCRLRLLEQEKAILAMPIFHLGR
ncbi:MAG TPA: signal peptide peptidase SppA [Planctomycetaceae bacterium]|nr:signal peptide peptidase SppA [Planctomycetaceae bacterium]